MSVKEVLTKQKMAAEVAKAAIRHAPAVSPEVATWLVPSGDQSVDWQVVIETVGAFLGRRRGEILDFDEAHQAELDREALLRVERDEAFAAMRDRLTKLRSLLEAHYGDRGAKVLPIGALERTPEGVWRQARLVINRLNEPDFVFPLSEISEPIPDRLVWVGDLEAVATRLGTALDALRGVSRAKEATLISRQQTVATFDNQVSGAIGVLEGLFKIAGATELAARVRPTTRRSRKTEPVTEPAPEPVEPVVEEPPIEEPPVVEEPPAPEPPTAGPDEGGDESAVN